MENIQKHDLGLTVTVSLEKSDTPWLLPLRPLLSVDSDGEISSEDLNSNTSISLPARFVLQLSQPMALTLESCHQIRRICLTRGGADMEFDFNDDSAVPLMTLIAKDASGGQLDTRNSRGLFVVICKQH